MASADNSHDANRLDRLSPKVRQQVVDREAAGRRRDLAWRRQSGQLEEADNLIATWRRRGIGPDGYPLDHQGPKQLG